MNYVCILFCLMLLSCGNAVTKEQRNTATCALSFSQQYFEWTHHERDFYVHYLQMENYSDACFDTIDFMRHAINYTDTASIYLPVSTIYFFKPCRDFETGDPDYQHWDRIRKCFVLSVHYSENSAGSDFPEIVSITRWIDGERFKIDPNEHSHPFNN